MRMRGLTNKIKRNKAKGLHDVVIEIVQVQGDSGTGKLTKITNAIYDKCEILEEFLKSIFIAFPKML